MAGESLNRVQLIGNLGKDPEVKFTPQGTPVAKITIATNEPFEDKAGVRQDSPEWPTVAVLLVVILFGCEVLPKTLAVRQPELWALRVAPPLLFFQKITLPLRWLARKLNEFILAIAVPKSIQSQATLTDADYQELLELATQQGALAQSEKEIILQIISLDRRTAKGGFGPLLYALAVQSGLSRAKQIVVLGDGAPWIWKLVAEHFPGAVQIVDLYHAQQPVWDVAHVVFGPSSQEACIWDKEACTLLVHGQIEELVAAIGKLPTIPPAADEGRSVPDKALDYFATNAQRMRYPAFRAQGMHVGSGIAEAACKTVVETRAKRAGMRWTPEGLDALLPLRTAKLNHTYDEFWEEQSRLVA